MGRFWSLLLLLVPVLGTAIFVASPFLGYWLPRNISDQGADIDHLFYVILWITGVIFLITNFALFWFMWAYDEKKSLKPAKYTHGNNKVELCWTIIPGFILLFLSFYQLNVWADITIYQPPEEELGATIEVTARQFEWRIRYPGPDQKFDTPDDIYHVNDLHVPLNEKVLIYLKSEDVLHSFFLPNLRVKQDIVPGSKIPIWFTARDSGQYDVVCAELCGWGHYKMKGRLSVESREDYDRWLTEMKNRQEAVQHD